MVYEFLLGISLGILLNIVVNIWTELLFRWWENFHPDSNKHIGLQLIICTIVTAITFVYITYLAYTLKPV
jgi:uncharacterized BrkB/YihY/UPF0761 family membrane protein